ncbi:MAG TPA: DUF748 domain-containing protein [Opitutaceae bacterium]|nr:DUF748 domain-containing protein [Opitutaceae bacterium]
MRAWPRWVSIGLAVLVVLLVAARVALPYIVRDQVNARLASIPGYTGRVDRIGIHLWRGAYSLHEISIYRQNGKLREPFFLATSIDFSLAWRELIHGRIVSDIVVDRGQLIFVQGPTEATSQKDADRRWQDVVNDLFPIDITYFELTNGLVRYIDDTRQPPVDLFVKNMRVVATGLRNRAGEGGGEFPAQINVEGDSLGGGKLALSLAAEPLAAQPHFHLSLKVDRVNLPALNQSLRAYANVDVGRGTFQMVAEMAGRDGGFQGYVKPFFQDLDFHNLEDKNKGIGGRVWERVVAGLAWLVKNKPRDQVATRIPFQGRFGDPQVGLGRTIANLFRHGFIRAFNPTIENDVNPDNILPNGQAANGQNVANVKSDTSPKKAVDDNETRAGAPTGRPSPPTGASR